MRATEEQYFAAMNSVGDQPLRHTVMFESNQVADRRIEYDLALVALLGSMQIIPGVRGKVIAEQSLVGPNIVEELTVDNPAALQGLREHKQHEAVLDLARDFTNWLVVDRVSPDPQCLEQRLVLSARSPSDTPFMRHVVFGLHEDTSASDVETALSRLSAATADAVSKAYVVPEVAASLDQRKGDVLIVRAIWPNLFLIREFEESADYRNVLDDLEGITARRMEAVHPVDLTY
jgi:hypothetical protein